MFYAGVPGFKQPPFYIHEWRVQQFACCPVLTKSNMGSYCCVFIDSVIFFGGVVVGVFVLGGLVLVCELSWSWSHTSNYLFSPSFTREAGAEVSGGFKGAVCKISLAQDSPAVQILAVSALLY